jgi:hypothetical protein
MTRLLRWEWVGLGSLHYVRVWAHPNRGGYYLIWRSGRVWHISDPTCVTVAAQRRLDPGTLKQVMRIVRDEVLAPALAARYAGADA